MKILTISLVITSRSCSKRLTFLDAFLLFLLAQLWIFFLAWRVRLIFILFLFLFRNLSLGGLFFHQLLFFINFPLFSSFISRHSLRFFLRFVNFCLFPFDILFIFSWTLLPLTNITIPILSLFQLLFSNFTTF